MSMDAEEKFFADLANFGSAPADEEEADAPGDVPEPNDEPDEQPETEEAADDAVAPVPGADLEPELAKASSAALKSAQRHDVTEELGEDDLFDEGPEGQLTIDVYQTTDDIVVESAIAGVKPENIDISVTNDSVSIRGTRRREHRVRDEDYYYQECYWGRFARSVILPQEVDPDNASVTFKNGVLTVRLPKLTRSKTKKLKVRTD